MYCVPAWECLEPTHVHKCMLGWEMCWLMEAYHWRYMYMHVREDIYGQHVYALGTNMSTHRRACL